MKELCFLMSLDPVLWAIHVLSFSLGGKLRAWPRAGDRNAITRCLATFLIHTAASVPGVTEKTVRVGVWPVAVSVVVHTPRRLFQIPLLFRTQGFAVAPGSLQAAALLG